MKITITDCTIDIKNVFVIKKGVFNLAENVVKVRVETVAYLVFKTCESLVYFKHRLFPLLLDVTRNLVSLHRPQKILLTDQLAFKATLMCLPHAVSAAIASNMGTFRAQAKELQALAVFAHL